MCLRLGEGRREGGGGRRKGGEEKEGGGCGQGLVRVSRHDIVATISCSPTNDKDHDDDEDDQENHRQGSNHTSQHWTNKGLGGGGRG